MAKCTNCGKPVPDGAKFCGHCGKTTGFEPNVAQQPPFLQYNVTPHEPTETKGNEAKNKAPAVKPNCDLSVAAFVLSVFNPLMCVVAFVLSAAALIKKQARRKLAFAALYISLIEIIAIAVGVYVVFFVLHVDLTQYLPFLKRE